MRRSLVTALAASLVLGGAVIASGCGASEANNASADARAATRSTPTQQARAPVPDGWVSIEDCQAVEAILNSLGGAEAEARAFLIDLNLGRDSKIRLQEDGTIAWLGGGKEDTGTCSFGPERQRTPLLGAPPKVRRLCVAEQRESAFPVLPDPFCLAQP